MAFSIDGIVFSIVGFEYSLVGIVFSIDGIVYSIVGIVSSIVGTLFSIPGINTSQCASNQFLPTPISTRIGNIRFGIATVIREYPA